MDHDLLQKGVNSQVKIRDAGSQGWKHPTGTSSSRVVGSPQFTVPAPEVENTRTERGETR